MEYIEIKNNDLIVSEKGNILNISLSKIENIKSSIETNISKMKAIIYILISFGIIFTLINISSNLFEKIVPENQLSAIYYEQGYSRYKIQPNGFGTSIYPVHIGNDGKFYYSIDFFAFILAELFILILLIFPSWLIFKTIKPSITANKINKHYISFLINKIEHTIYTGDYHKTKEILIQLKHECKKAHFA